MSWNWKREAIEKGEIVWLKTRAKNCEWKREPEFRKRLEKGEEVANFDDWVQNNFKIELKMTEMKFEVAFYNGAIFAIAKKHETFQM